MLTPVSQIPALSNFQIYPYWNVNKGKKAEYMQLAAFQIYPYWNVNKVVSELEKLKASFQIYPYWNVNITWCRALFYVLKLSNLSILECKCVV